MRGEEGANNLRVEYVGCSRLTNGDQLAVIIPYVKEGVRILADRSDFAQLGKDFRVGIASEAAHGRRGLHCRPRRRGTLAGLPPTSPSICRPHSSSASRFSFAKV